MKVKKRYSLTPNSTNLILLTSEKGHEIGEQFTMNLLGIPQQAMDIPEEKKKEVFLISIEIFKKLSKLANAVDKYLNEEDKLIKEFTNRVISEKTRISHHSDILEGAIEEVLSQAKSTLDVAVKIFKPLFGVKLHTYGENGDQLIKAFKNNVPLADRKKAENIVKVIELFKPYSKSIIGLRTTIQHYKNISMTPLTAELDSDGKVIIYVPKISQTQTAKEFSEVVYHNIFIFIRDLLTFSFVSKFHKGIVPIIIEEKGERIKKIGVTIAEVNMR